MSARTVIEPPYRPSNHASMNLQILQVAARKCLVGNDLNLPIALLRDHHSVTEVACAAVDFDPVVQKLLEGTDVEDFVIRWLGGIDYELWRCVSQDSSDGSSCTLL